MNRAKQLFFDYDGSTFYMSRDGVDVEYRGFKVSRSQEVSWLKELTRRRLSELAEPGNHMVIHFLNHHRDYSHMDEILDSEPLGKLWEKTAFLESLMEYLGHRRFDKETITRCLSYIVSHAKAFLSLSRSEKSRSRLGAIIETANRMLARGSNR